MKSSEAPTVKAKRSPVILVVGFPPALVRRCDEAAAGLHATVMAVDLGAESAFAMHTLPVALVMDAARVQSSPLGAIAGDLGIELVAISEEAATGQIREHLVAALGAARRRSQPPPA